MPPCGSPVPIPAQLRQFLAAVFTFCERVAETTAEATRAAARANTQIDTAQQAVHSSLEAGATASDCLADSSINRRAPGSG